MLDGVQGGTGKAGCFLSGVTVQTSPATVGPAGSSAPPYPVVSRFPADTLVDAGVPSGPGGSFAAVAVAGSIVI